MGYIPPKSESHWDKFIGDTMDQADLRLNTLGTEYFFYRMMKMCSVFMGADKFKEMTNRVIATYQHPDK